ncbi:MAG: SDR family NAD(P)-dependent oxidoreductase [Bacteroidetes bacterium]|nr:SDR family NAD(P)-dependent oxidoreductase [Bacteroidota bacterium]
MKAVQEPENIYAVVTGASQGLGKAFASELAEQGFNLVLVSLPGQQLQDLSLKLANLHGIKTAYYETDLAVSKNVIDLGKWINENFQVFMLINNAGTGGSGKFANASVEYLQSVLQLNVMATSILTHELLPNLSARKQSYILNVSSMAAFTPTGFKTVYPASKSFVHSFSRGLYEELKHSNVFVSVVNPGAMKTSEDIVARIEKQGILGRITLLEPSKVARKCIRQLFRRDTVIMVNPISWLVLKLIPIWIKLPLMTNAIKRELA